MISGTPQAGATNSDVVEPVSIQQFQEIVRHLSRLTAQDEINLDRFLISKGSFHGHILVGTFRMKLMSLFGWLRQKYFPDDRLFGGSPDTVITLTQNQVQEVHQQMVVELAAATALKAQQFKEGTTERRFLDKLQDALKGVKSAKDLVETVLGIGAHLGQTAEAILKILPWT